MTINEFLDGLLRCSSDDAISAFTQRTVLHGTPKVFEGREHDFFSFKQRICDTYQIRHTDIFIVGSAKLGFSPFKRTDFSLNSDVDVAIVSSDLFDRVLSIVADFEYALRSNRDFLTDKQRDKYLIFLRYLMIGWMRPDGLPYKAPCQTFKDEWFDFFEGISHGKSEVGNYKVTCGVFRSHADLERYHVESNRKVLRSAMVEQAR